MVDAAAFMPEWQRADSLAERGVAADPEDDRTVPDLLVSQVEFADLIVLNKVCGGLLVGVVGSGRRSVVAC